MITQHNLSPHDLGRLDAALSRNGCPAVNPFPAGTLAHQDWAHGWADESMDIMAEIDGVAA